MRVIVTTTPAPLITNSADGADRQEYSDAKARTYICKNATGTAPIMLRRPDEVDADAYQWDVAEGSWEVRLEPGESFLAFVASGTQTVHILRTGR